MNRHALLVLMVVVFVCHCLGAMDLTSWTKVDRYHRWSFSNPATDSVRLDEASSSSTVAPGWVVSDFLLNPTSTFSITLQVLNSGDDDFVGLIFGYSDADHFYLLDWKRSTQSYNWGDVVAVNDDVAEQGIKIKKINGSWTRDGLWGGTDGLGVSTIAGPVGGAWNFNTAYTFTFDLSPGHIVVTRNGAPLFDLYDDTFIGGRIGGYGFSQDDLLFYEVTVTPDPRTCVVTIEDLALFARYWLKSAPYVPADFDNSGTVDTGDLLYLAGYWLDDCPAGWPLK